MPQDTDLPVIAANVTVLQSRYPITPRHPTTSPSSYTSDFFYLPMLRRGRTLFVWLPCLTPTIIDYRTNHNLKGGMGSGDNPKHQGKVGTD